MKWQDVQEKHLKGWVQAKADEGYFHHPGPEGRGYGADFWNGKVGRYDWSMSTEDFNDYHILVRRVSAQIGDRMALAVVKEYEEIESWVLAKAAGRVLHDGFYWFFRELDDCALFKLRWC